MSYAPCKNQNCRSYGKPHPNCKCYGGMAAGGSVEPYCSSDRPHLRECEFFAEGGDVVPEDDLPQAEPEAAEVPADDLPTDAVPEEDLPATEPMSGETVPEDDTPVVGDALGALGTAVAEGVPILGPLAAKAGRATTAALNQLTPDAMLPPEWQGKSFSEVYDALTAFDAQQAASHPVASTVGDLLGSTAGFGAADKAAAAAAKAAGLGKVGSGILRGAISNGIIQGSDEASKMMLGQDPDQPVASLLISIGLGGLLGGVGAKASSVATQKLEKLTEKNVGDRATSWLAGIGAGANPKNEKMGTLVREMEKIPGFDKKSFEAGTRAYEGLMRQVAPTVGVGAAAGYGYHQDGLEGALKYGSSAAGLGVLRKFAGKVTAPVVLKVLSNDTTLGMLDALSHAEKVSRGVKAVDKAIEGLFTGGAKAITTGIGDSKKIEDWLEGGGIAGDIDDAIEETRAAEVPQGFAEGGEVKPLGSRKASGVALHFPEQNVVMQAAKARAATYLNGLRPSGLAPKLAFDDPPDHRKQKKAYKRALTIAAQPLRVLDEIKRGTVEPEDIKHLNSMFPEVTGLLQRKLTERIAKAQLADKKPSLRVRQGLSMLLGTALSGEFTPQSIQAAQAVFQRQAQSQPQPQKGAAKPTQTGLSKLSKSDRAHLTDDQARAARQQRT